MGKSDVKLVSVREFAEGWNEVRSRRGYKMSEGYLYRLIREDMKGIGKRPLWFKYELVGEKGHILVQVDN